MKTSHILTQSYRPLESPGELPPDPADEQLHQLLVVHVEELVKVDPPGEKVEGK